MLISTKSNLNVHRKPPQHKQGNEVGWETGCWQDHCREEQHTGGTLRSFARTHPTTFNKTLRLQVRAFTLPHKGTKEEEI